MIAAKPGFRRLQALALASVLLGFSLIGVRALASDQSYAVDAISRAQGLPNSNVTAALQSRDGYLWIATGGGLARFDGVRFVSYRPSNTPAFLTSLVISLFEDRDGALWIGTARGVVRLKDGEFKFLGLKDTSVDSFAQDRTGRIWIGTHEEGLFYWENGQLHHETSYDKLPSQFVTCLMIDASGKLWIGSGAPGVDRYDNGSYTHFGGDTDLRDRIDSICEFPAGTVWLGTHAHGLARLRGTNVERFASAQGLASPVVSCVRPALGGGLWIVSGALQKLTETQPVSIATVAQNPGHTMVWECEDREGGIWICAREDGLSRVHRVPYQLISKESGLTSSAVRTVAEDQSGSLWFSLQRQGVARVSPEGYIQNYTHLNGLPSDDISFAYPGTDGRIWMASNDSLVLWNGTSSQRVTSLTQVRGIYRDSEGSMWFGTDDVGLFRYTNGALKRIDYNSGLPILHATAFSEAPDHTLFIGSWAEGIIRLKDGTTTLYDLAKGLPTNEVRAVYSDKEGNLWAGLRGRGLALFQNGSWWNPDSLSEAVGDHVSAITDDTHGRLWLGTAAGVAWLSKKEALAAAAGTGPVPVIHLIGLGEAVGQLQAWSGAQPTVWTAHDGRLVFATRSGALLIDPNNLAVNTVAPPVLIESVLVDRKAEAIGDGIDLPAGARQISVSYTALSFVQTDRVVFRYRLDGYDKDWVDAGTRRTATYTNLPRGHYIFRVSACNSDGVWNDSGANLAVIQEPHFFETNWFYAAVALAAAALAMGAYRWSNRRLRLKLERLEEKQAMDRERQRIARHLHDDLGGDLTEIGLFAEAARRKQTLEEALNDVSSLSERVRGLLGSLDTIVWSVNPDNDSLDQVAVYICEYFQDRFRRLSIRCRLDIGDDPPAYRLTPEQRKQPVPCGQRSHEQHHQARPGDRGLASHAHARECISHSDRRQWPRFPFRPSPGDQTQRAQKHPLPYQRTFRSGGNQFPAGNGDKNRIHDFVRGGRYDSTVRSVAFRSIWLELGR